MVLVTGGTGLLGSHLLFKLLDDGEHHIRATYRSTKKLERVKQVFSYYSDDYEDLFSMIDWVEADINDIPALIDIFKDVSLVYHCAAFVSFEPDKYKTLRKVNIKGTANIVNLCITNGIKKLCYVSSIAALGHSIQPKALIDEETAWNPDEDNSVYAITKYGAELEVWRGTQEGVDAVVVNPGIILGEGHWRGGSSASLFRKIYKGMSYYTTGVSGFVDIKDVVRAMTSLMASPIKNERFILTSENWTFEKFQTRVAKHLGVKPPHKEAKPWMLNLAWRLDWINHKLFRKRRSISKHNAQSMLQISRYDNSKIKSVLNMEFMPIEDSIARICAQFKKDENS